MVKRISVLKLEYKINIVKEKKLKLFGRNFVNNNHTRCKIIYNNKEYDLKEYFDDIIVDYKNQDLIKIKLSHIDNICNASYMFAGCNSLLSLKFISKWDTSKIINMSHMFEDCDSLKFLTGISEWNTSNVINMRLIFSGCTSLKSLPDISK